MNQWAKELMIPSIEEVYELGKAECEITAQYVKMQAYYTVFVMEFLKEMLGLDRLDKRLEDQNFLPVSFKNRDFYQSYQSGNMNYIYLRSFVHIERLHYEQKKFLSSLNENMDELQMKRAAELIEDTWSKVLKLDEEHPEYIVEEFESIDGSGIFSGNAILLGIGSEARYNEKDNYADPKKEEDRVNLFCSVADQMEKIFSKMLQANIKIVLNI